MNLETHLLDLVAANGEETALRQIYGSCSPSRVRRVSSKVGAAARADSDLVVMLSLEQRVALTKSVARLEDMIGGVGSPTAVQWLLPHLKEWESDTLDWVLRYTSSFGYFSKAKTADAYTGEKEALRKAKAERFEREERRQMEARQRKARIATERLEKAVVRGDKKAVVALLDRGADPNVRGESGHLPIAVARESGHSEIVKIIEGNPFEKNPFRDDFTRVSKLYRYGAVFAEHLERASAISMAKLIAVRFNLIVRIERLHVRLLLGEEWDEDDGDGDWFEHRVPDEWVACHEPRNWAVTLSDNSTKKVAALREWYESYLLPFSDMEKFEERSLEPVKQARQPVKQARGEELHRLSVAEIKNIDELFKDMPDLDELGNDMPDLDEWYPYAKEWDPRRQDFEHELRPPDHSVNYIYDPEE